MADEGQQQSNAQPGQDAAQPGTNQASEGQQPWHATFKEAENRAVVDNKHWSDPEAPVKAYRELESFTSRIKNVPPDRLLALPEKLDDPEQMAPVYNRLGRPEKPEGYELPVPEGYDSSLADAMRPLLYKHGVSKAGAAELATVLNQFTAEAGVEQAGKYAYTTKALREQQAQENQVQLDQLKREWGAAYDQRVELGRRAVRQYAPDPETLTQMENLIGSANLLKLWANIGAGQGEHSFEDGTGQPADFGMTPDQALMKSRQLMSDPEWFKRFRANPDGAEGAELSRLQQIAASGAAGRQGR